MEPQLSLSTKTNNDERQAENTKASIVYTEDMKARKKSIDLQDNKSAILLPKNRRRSAGKRSRALNIPHFYVTDLISKECVKIIYYPTNKVIGYFITKPLQGMKFIKFYNIILGIE